MSKPTKTMPLAVECHLYALRHSVVLFLGTGAELRKYLARRKIDLAQQQDNEIDFLANDDCEYVATILEHRGDVVIFAPRGLTQAVLVHECVHAADRMMNYTGVEGTEARAYITEYLFTSFSERLAQLPLSRDAVSPRREECTARCGRRAPSGRASASAVASRP